MKQGYVYIFPTADHKTMKIGQTEELYFRLTGKYPNGRVEGLLDTWKIDTLNIFYVKTTNYKELEKELHEHFQQYNIYTEIKRNGYTEFFELKIWKQVIELIEKKTKQKMKRFDHVMFENKKEENKKNILICKKKGNYKDTFFSKKTQPSSQAFVKNVVKKDEEKDEEKKVLNLTPVIKENVQEPKPIIEKPIINNIQNNEVITPVVKENIQKNEPIVETKTLKDKKTLSEKMILLGAITLVISVIVFLK